MATKKYVDDSITTTKYFIRKEFKSADEDLRKQLDIYLNGVRTDYLLRLSKINGGLTKSASQNIDSTNMILEGIIELKKEITDLNKNVRGIVNNIATLNIQSRLN